MKVTFLGTGTSQGVPVIACNCEVCKSTDSKDARLRSSIMIEVNNNVFVVDAGPDFRQQMLREKVKHLDAILFTHSHKDHTAGLDDIRAFNYVTKKAMDIYAEKNVNEVLKKEFAYAFAELKYPGVPKMHLHEIENSRFVINQTEIIPIRVMHLRLPIFGYRIKDFAYITDANYINPEEIEKLKNIKTLVINALRKKKHISHFTLDEALDLIKKIKPQRAFLTHISHLMGKYKEIESTLPDNVFQAWDGLKIEI